MIPLYFYRDCVQWEIDIIIDEDRKLYSIKIMMTGNPIKAMSKHSSVLNHIPSKEIQSILSYVNRITYLKENMVALSINYI